MFGVLFLSKVPGEWVARQEKDPLKRSSIREGGHKMKGRGLGLRVLPFRPYV